MSSDTTFYEIFESVKKDIQDEIRSVSINSVNAISYLDEHSLRYQLARFAMNFPIEAVDDYLKKERQLYTSSHHTLLGFLSCKARVNDDVSRIEGILLRCEQLLKYETKSEQFRKSVDAVNLARDLYKFYIEERNVLDEIDKLVRGEFVFFVGHRARHAGMIDLATKLKSKSEA